MKRCRCRCRGREIERVGVVLLVACAVLMKMVLLTGLELVDGPALGDATGRGGLNSKRRRFAGG